MSLSKRTKSIMIVALADKKAATELSAAVDSASLPDTGVTPGSYTSANITVDAQGRISAASNGSGGGILPFDTYYQIIGPAATPVDIFKIDSISEQFTFAVNPVVSALRRPGGAVNTIDLTNFQLKTPDDIARIDWTGVLNDDSGLQALNFTTRQLINAAGDTLLDWSGSNLLPGVTNTVNLGASNRTWAKTFTNAISRGGSTATIIDVNSFQLKDPTGLINLDWANGLLNDGSEVRALNWPARVLVNAADAEVLNWTDTNISVATDINFATGATATLRTKNDSIITRGLNITTGNSTGDETGAISIFPGSSSVASNGSLSLFTPDTLAADLISGNVSIYTGGASGTGVSGNVTVGTGPTSDGNSGILVLVTGSSGDGNTGSTTLGTGTPSGTGNSGSVEIYSGGLGPVPGNSGNVNITSGNLDSTGTSGNVSISTGTTVGGTRGQIQLKDGSEGIVGSVWTSTDATGKGAWSTGWQKFTFDFNDFTTFVGLQNGTVDIVELPLGWALTAVQTRVSVEFNSPTATLDSDYQFNVGNPFTATAYISSALGGPGSIAANEHLGYAPGGRYASTFLGAADFSSNQMISLGIIANAGAGTLDTLTAGEIEVWVKMENLNV